MPDIQPLPALLAAFSASLLFALPATAQSPASTQALPAARVKAISAMLTEKPEAPGRPLSDRAFWENLAKQPGFNEMVTKAEALLKQPLPEQPDDLFLEYSKNGNRTRFQNVANSRRSRLTPLVLAECIENKGHFLPAIEQLIAALSVEKTWVLPAHDTKLENFNGKTIDIDLVSSALAWNLSIADYLLGDRLSATAREQLRENVKRRVLVPFRDMYTGKRPKNWWMTTTNNWNAVCLAGVTGAGLAELPTREERAEFVAAAEMYSKNFLAGFTADGYCSEGLGYWNYGFGNYLLLSEAVRLATSGKVDLITSPEAKMPATFGGRIQIINGLSPAFADCPIFARPAAPVMGYVNNRFGLGLAGYDKPVGPQSTLSETLIYLPSNAPKPATTTVAAKTPAGAPLRDWFDKAGVYVGRPTPGSKVNFGVAFKGGNNAEHHNHNDLGSFTVITGERPVVLDPGSETYTARTFSSRRYESKLLNSFGHPVPVIAGVLQKEGAKSVAKILKADFTPTADTVTMDITSAYPVPALKSLQRTFVYSRQNTGSLTVTDRVENSSPQTFGTALLTLGSWQQQPDGSLMIYDVEDALKVEIDTGGLPFTVKAEEVHEEASTTATRLGINLNNPVASATVTLKITPVNLASDSTALLRNGGFEAGSWGWSLPAGSFGSISTEQAASGKASLKLSDNNPNTGSNIVSARIPIPAGGGWYVVKGKVYHASGKGIGLYVRYLDTQSKVLNASDTNGNMAPVGSLTGDEGKWVPFSYRFQVPADATFLQLWLHSFNGALVEAYLDDLEVTAEK